MKYLFTLPLLLFAASSATAQDYHLFPNPADTLAFADQGDNLRHIRFDSIKTDGNTTYFPMKEVSFGMPDDTCWGRNPFDGWMGGSISDSLRSFHFLHESYDFRIDVNDLSTSFQTVGSLKGDTGDFILELKYDSTSYRSIAIGGSDSIRHFSLRAVDPNGQRPATFPNDRLISASKNHGLMQFPQLIGRAQNFSRTTHHTLTKKADIYDYEIGDEFHYRFGTYSITHPQGNKSRRSKKILIDKQVFPAQDSIYYLWQKHFVHEDPSRPPPNNFITGVDTLVQGVGNASAPQPHLLSYETGFSENDPAYLYHQAHAIKGRPGYTIHENHYEYGADTICILPALEPSNRVTKMAAGIGLVNDEYDSHQTKRQVKNRLVYYKKGAETWGTPLANFGIHELQREVLSVYPNPVKDVFSIQLPKGEDPFSVRIYNQVGQKVLETEIRPGENSFSMARLPKGVYFVQSEAGTVKVVKE